MASPMMLARTALRPQARRMVHSTQWTRSLGRRFRPEPEPQQDKSNLALRILTGVLAGGLVAGAAMAAYPMLTGGNKKEPMKVELIFQEPRKRSISAEESREQLSPQHVQVKHSWEHPGVYAWGSNVGKVVAPDSNELVIKTPRRIAYFDDQVLRDLKLDRNFGAAIDEKGNLVQWGVGFDKDHYTPTVTLKGKDLVKLDVSRDRIIGLASNGEVYSIPVAAADQRAGQKETTASPSSLWSSQAPVNYRPLTPKNLRWGEKIVDVRSGLEHCLMLTSNGRVFSAAASSEDFPSKGQLGVPGLTWTNRPAGPYDQPYEVTGLSGSKIKEIAAGDYHSLALDTEGRVYAFGDNSFGQLGFENDTEHPYVDSPRPVPISKLYHGTNLRPKVTYIAAGGPNSFFTVDARAFQGQLGGDGSSGQGQIVPAKDLGRVNVETWACGEGIHGTLGNGKWTHVSVCPTKVKALSNLFEFDEATNQVVPIRLSRMSVGGNHACAVMDNFTCVDSPLNGNVKSDTDTNFGADVLWWGGNEHYQLGTGKRNNVNTPSYIVPLDTPTRRGPAHAQENRLVQREGESNRFQLTPRKTVKLDGRSVSIEQRAECGRDVSAVYSAA
ncbi:regulator of chromosome condensation 1/beta-lactamase-inhibitor protein II [Neurospora hispaniola]|uniref:Regulator of chromosome condensation 1/beta-lactamase-inhibitor protein II n=1 Tax=Neurospora hispaniola TaxID=588809 RepID=A0AAJ0MMS0_9PEZI|nr:regulator of chromosome condensation 1/beta-lactamase-inhibitor protein II [Neurospora hispaniola]